MSEPTKTGEVNRRDVLRGAVGAGASAVALSGAAGAQGDFGGWLSDTSNYDGTVADKRGQEEVTVGVGTEGNGGAFAFSPPAIQVDPGTTVRFEWTGEGGGHNVVSESGPADLDSGDPVAEPGVHYEYTFEEDGINTYYCVPHLALGMKGGIAVGDVPTAGAPGGPPGDGDGDGRLLPGGNLGVTFMAIVLGSAAFAAVAVFLGEYYRSMRGREAAPEPEAEAEAAGAGADPWTGVVREIGHDGFDPTGTASLILLYFLILLVMWVFVYFVEFLGGGPTVIG